MVWHIISRPIWLFAIDLTQSFALQAARSLLSILDSYFVSSQFLESPMLPGLHGCPRLLLGMLSLLLLLLPASGNGLPSSPVDWAAYQRWRDSEVSLETVPATNCQCDMDTGCTVGCCCDAECDSELLPAECANATARNTETLDYCIGRQEIVKVSRSE